MSGGKKIDFFLLFQGECLEDSVSDSRSSGQCLHIDGAFWVIRVDQGYASGFCGTGINGASREMMDEAEHHRKSTSARF